MTGLQIKPLCGGRHFDIFSDGRKVGVLWAPLFEITPDQWSVGLDQTPPVIRSFATREDALRFLGIAERVAEAA